MSARENVQARAVLAVSANQMDSLARRLSAARYAFHRVIVHKYAMAVLAGGMTEEMAMAHYDEAMRNFDGIVANAANGASQEMNMADMAKGSAAVTELIEAWRKRNG